MAEQQQFDWQKETAKCVEGLKFDLNQEYKFELVFEGVELYHTSKKQEDGTRVPSYYKTGAKQGEPVLKYKFPFKELNSNVEFTLEYFKNDSYRVNPANPELEDDIVKLSRKLGYSPVLDGNFKVSDFIKAGLVFTAKLIDLEPNSKGKVYKTIDISTIKTESSGSVSQEKFADISNEDMTEVHEMAKGCKKFSELVSRINKAGKSDELLDVAMRLKEQGKLKF